MTEKHESVSELLKHITDDADFRRQFEQEKENKALARTLFAMRCREGVSQADMASLLGCSQSKVSKLENSNPDRIKVSDLVGYARALKLQMSIGFHRNMTSAQCVKFHVFQIKKHLDDLAELANRGDDILKGVTNFYGEFLFNVLCLVEQSVQKLPDSQPDGPVLEIRGPDELDTCILDAAVVAAES